MTSDRGLSRRTVLLGGSAVVLAATAVGRLVFSGSGGDGSLARLATSAGPKISVGFVDAVPAAQRPLDFAGARRVVPASRVRVGDLGSSTTVRIAGATPGLLEDGPAAGLQLDALFPNSGGSEPLRYFAWTYRADPASASTPSRFTAPVDVMSLGFALNVVPFSGEERAATSVMTAGREHDLPRLRTGTYLLGLEPGVWDEATRLPAAGDRAWADLASLAITLTPAG